MTALRLDQPGFFVRKSFTDVDELAVLARAWDLDFRQLNRGGFQGSLLQFGNARFQAARSGLRGILHQSGSTPEFLRTFAVPARDEIQLVWRGHRIAPNQILVFPAGGELDCSSTFDFDMFVLSLSAESLDRAALEVGIDWPASILAEAEVVTCAPATIALLRSGCADMVSEIAEEPGRVNQAPTLERLEHEMARLLVIALTSGRATGADIDLVRRVQQTEAAVRIARQSWSQPLTVAQLCRQVGASERTLRRGFQEHLGVSPKVFLKAQVMVGVRRALRASSPEVACVADVANRFGIWHLGQFAADYREHFGELPSATLRDGS